MLRTTSAETRRAKRGNAVFRTMHYTSIGNLAKLGQKKQDVYANIFYQIDKDENGALDKDEFRDATKALNLFLTEDELDKIYHSLASDNQGITLESFTKFIRKSVRIHKQFLRLQEELRASILKKTACHSAPSTSFFQSPKEGDPLMMNGNASHSPATEQMIESPIYHVRFDDIKLSHFPLLSDKHRKNCFVGKIEKEQNRFNLIPHSHIVTVNNVQCEDIGYDKVIHLLDCMDLPHTVKFRKTVGLAVELGDDTDGVYFYHDADDEEEEDEQDEEEEEAESQDTDINDSETDSASICDSEKYVVHDRAESDAEDDNQGHCKYCPDKSSHPFLFALHRTMEDESYSKLSFCIITYVMVCIIVSTVTYIIETMPVIQESERAVLVLLRIEWVVSVSFTLEYLLRIISVRSRCKWFRDLMNFIDFLAVVPFWIEMASGSAGASVLRVIRVVRLARIIRLMKSDRFIEYLNVFGATIKRSSESFGLLATLILLQVILFGSIFYVIEAETNPNFNSIPMGCFYTVVTITTVGYGDSFPNTALGRVVAVVCMFLGLLVVALPVIIIGGNFEKEFRSYQLKKTHQAIEDKAKLFDDNLDNDENIKLSKADRGFGEVYRFLKKVNAKCERNVFQAEDAHLMCLEGLNSEQRLLELLYDDTGFAFYPNSIQKFKVFVLHELYGSHVRQMKIKSDLLGYS